MKLTKKQLQKLIREQVMVQEDSIDDLEIETRAEEIGEFIKSRLMGNPMPINEKTRLLSKIYMIVDNMLTP
jgi:hypothetical protein